MKLEKVLWSDGYSDEAFLIDKEEIEERACVGDQTLIIENIKADIEDLQKRVDEWDKEIIETWEMEEFLESIGFTKADVSWAKEFPEIEKTLAFDCWEQDFFYLTDCATIKAHEWWNGSNWQTLVLDENTSETELVITESYVDLDEWDGRNHVTGGMGEHQRIYKVLEMDGENVQDKDIFLLNKWSQWEGSHETGEILEGLDEVKKHLKSIGRDVDEYMKGIGKLSGE